MLHVTSTQAIWENYTIIYNVFNKNRNKTFLILLQLNAMAAISNVT